MFSKKKVFKIFFRQSQKKGLQNFFAGEKGLQNFFSGDLYLWKPKKRSLQIFRKVSGVFQQNFNVSKIVLSSSRGRGNFRGLKASRPRTSKCVLKAKDVLEDSTSGKRRQLLRRSHARFLLLCAGRTRKNLKNFEQRRRR